MPSIITFHALKVSNRSHFFVNFNQNRKIARFKGNIIKQAQQLYSLAIVRWKDKVEKFKAGRVGQSTIFCDKHIFTREEREANRARHPQAEDTCSHIVRHIQSIKRRVTRTKLKSKRKRVAIICLNCASLSFVQRLTRSLMYLLNASRCSRNI